MVEKASRFQWNKPPHNRASLVADVDGVGRFLVRRHAKGSRQFVVLLNGVEIGLFSDRADAVSNIERSFKGE